MKCIKIEDNVSLSVIGNATLFTQFSFTIFVPLNPPLPTSKVELFFQKIGVVPARQIFESFLKCWVALNFSSFLCAPVSLEAELAFPQLDLVQLELPRPSWLKLVCLASLKGKLASLILAW